MDFWLRYYVRDTESLSFYPKSGDLNFDHLVTVESIRFLHQKGAILSLCNEQETWGYFESV